MIEAFIAYDHPELGIPGCIPFRAQNPDEAYEIAHVIASEGAVRPCSLDMGFVNTYLVVYAYKGRMRATSVESTNYEQARRLLEEMMEIGTCCVCNAETT